MPAVVLLLATAVLGAAAWRIGAPSAGRLATLALIASGLGVISGARVTGAIGSYLVRWWWVIAAVVWLSVSWSTWSLLSRTRARVAVAAVAVVGLLALAGLMAGRAVSVHVPGEGDSVAVGQLGDQIAGALGDEGAYVVDWTDARDWGAVGAGVFVDLERRGLAVEAASRFAPTFGSWRTAPIQSGDGLVLVVGADDVARGFQPPPDATVIAEYEPLTATEQQRLDALQQQIRGSLGSAEEPDWTLADSAFGRQVLRDQGVPAALVDQLSELRARGRPTPSSSSRTAEREPGNRARRDAPPRLADPGLAHDDGHGWASRRDRGRRRGRSASALGSPADDARRSVDTHARSVPPARGPVRDHSAR